MTAEASERFLQFPPTAQLIEAAPAAAPILFSEPAAESVGEVIEQPIAAPEIRLGNTFFRVDEIDMIRSEDHYLAVFARGRKDQGRKDLVRARMAESVAKLDIRYGVQVNRSTLVAFALVKELVKTDTTLEAHLIDGSIEIVATVRHHAVSAAFDLFKRQSKERSFQQVDA